MSVTIKDHVERLRRMEKDHRMNDSAFRARHQSKFTRAAETSSLPAHYAYCEKARGKYFRAGSANESFAEMLQVYEDYLDALAHHITVSKRAGHNSP